MRVLTTDSKRQTLPLLAAAMISAAISVVTVPAVADPAPSAPSRYLVQAANLSSAVADVESVGGKVERKLDVIHAVSAYLDASQAARLRALPAVHLFADRKLHTQGLASFLGSLTAPVQNTVNSVNSTVATNSVVKAVTSVTAPVSAAVTQAAHPVLAPVTAPLVAALQP